MSRFAVVIPQLPDYPHSRAFDEIARGSLISALVCSSTKFAQIMKNMTSCNTRSSSGVKFGSYGALLTHPKWSRNAWAGLAMCSAGMFFGDALRTRRGDPEGAFHRAEIKIRQTYRTPVEHHQPTAQARRVAAGETNAGERAVGDIGRPVGFDPGRALGAVHEAEQVALVEVPEALQFVRDHSQAVQSEGQLMGQFEAQVEPLAADVEDEVARGGRRVVGRTVQLDERVQTVGLRFAGEQPVPRLRADSGDAGRDGVRVAETDCPDDRGDVAEGGTDGLLPAVRNGHHQDDGRLGRHYDNGLRDAVHTRSVTGRPAPADRLSG